MSINLNCSCGNCSVFCVRDCASNYFLLLMMNSSSLKQSGIHAGNPWPPYKERTPLHPCYKGLIKLLHCKTLHIVIFTLLYKVSLSTPIRVSLHLMSRPIQFAHNYKCDHKLAKEFTCPSLKTNSPLCSRYGWIIKTCQSMCCAWCCTSSSWAWTTKFKTTRRMG